MRAMHACAIVALGALTAGATAQTNGGFGVGGDPPTGPFGTEQIPGAPAPPIEVGSPNEPIPVFPDPSAPFWTKDFFIGIDGVGISTGDTFTICEYITFEPSSALPQFEITDWHETILTDLDGPNLEWLGGTIDILDPATGQGAPLPGLNPMAMGPDFWFFFDPIPVGELPLTIKITKEIIWTGPTITGMGDPNPINFRVVEYITPAPGAASLMALGVLGAMRRRR